MYTFFSQFPRHPHQTQTTVCVFTGSPLLSRSVKDIFDFLFMRNNCLSLRLMKQSCPHSFFFYNKVEPTNVIARKFEFRCCFTEVCICLCSGNASGTCLCFYCLMSWRCKLQGVLVIFFAPYDFRIMHWDFLMLEKLVVGGLLVLPFPTHVGRWFSK